MKIILSLLVLLFSLQALAQELTEASFKEFKQAKTEMKEGDYASAAERLEKVKSQASANAFVLNMLVECYTNLNNWPKAKAALQEYSLSSGQSENQAVKERIQYIDKKIGESQRSDESEWSRAQRENTPEAYQRYINSAPHPFHKQEAITKIDELDYNKAVSGNSEGSYAEYIRKHPNGKYTTKAKSWIRMSIEGSNNVIQQEVARYDALYRKKKIQSNVMFGLTGISFGSMCYVLYDGVLKNDKLTKTQAIIGGASIGGILVFVIIGSQLQGRAYDYKATADGLRKKIRVNPYAANISIPGNGSQTYAGLSLQIKL